MEPLVHAAYLASVVMFMLALQRMGRVRTARQGNALAAGAMLLAVVASFVEMGRIDPVWILAGLALGGVAGTLLALRVPMTHMPEMVALLNGFGGLASALVGLGTFFQAADPSPGGIAGASLVLTVLVGGLTFSGSLVAFLKLSERIAGRPILLPGRHWLNVALAASAVAAACLPGAAPLIAVLLLSLALGVTLVIPIGGGDMPVVISLLNSYSGVAAALAGFTLGSPVLVVSGSLVGAAGLILTRIMCKAMNRGLASVMLGGFGGESAGAGGGEYGPVKSCSPDEVAMLLADARQVILVPGYGMAVAQAQHAVRELATMLEGRGATIRYAIHPVAGRMPGHMNVLLAEANVPYEQLAEMDEINRDFKNTDVVLVVGANDIVNPAAKSDPKSPLYGMPMLDVEEARSVFTIKRSLGAGFSGVKNGLFEHERNTMVYGDAKRVLEEVAKALKEA